MRQDKITFYNRRFVLMQALDQPDKAFNTIWEGSSERTQSSTLTHDRQRNKGTKRQRDKEERGVS